jgi:1-phosphatidylinositol-3-phosphate 5-kinase
VVLQDGNVVAAAEASPLMLRPFSRRALAIAVFNDSALLAALAVMDYSLLAGIDDASGEVVCGIVDYARTYTLDKQLETMLKTAVSAEQPTVVRPEAYRDRFRQGMRRYFHAVPMAGQSQLADAEVIL